MDAVAQEDNTPRPFAKDCKGVRIADRGEEARGTKVQCGVMAMFGMNGSGEGGPKGADAAPHEWTPNGKHELSEEQRAGMRGRRVHSVAGEPARGPR